MKHQTRSTVGAVTLSAATLLFSGDTYRALAQAFGAGVALAAVIPLFCITLVLIMALVRDALEVE